MKSATKLGESAKNERPNARTKVTMNGIANATTTTTARTSVTTRAKDRRRRRST